VSKNIHTSLRLNKIQYQHGCMHTTITSHKKITYYGNLKDTSKWITRTWQDYSNSPKYFTAENWLCFQMSLKMTEKKQSGKVHLEYGCLFSSWCPGFCWDIVNFLAGSCCSAVFWIWDENNVDKIPMLLVVVRPGLFSFFCC